MTTPFEAQQIAQQCVHWMTALQGARTKGELSQAWSGWSLYAKGAGVCRQIRDHMAEEYARTAQSLDKNRVVRDPTGEELL